MSWTARSRGSATPVRCWASRNISEVLLGTSTTAANDRLSRRTSHRTLTVAALIWALVATSLTLATETSPATDRDEFVHLIYTGQLHQAYDFLSRRPAEMVGQTYKSLESDLAKFVTIDDQSNRARRDVYADTVDKARKELADGRLEEALTQARKAKFYADDEDAFGQQEFVRQIVAEALLRAEKYLKDHDWLKAGNIYGELSAIYPNEKIYEEKTRDCARRIRLEAIYAKDEPWNDRLKDITLDVVPDVSKNINALYVETPNLRELAIDGLQAMRLIPQVAKLGETFPTLKDRDKTARFDFEVEGLIKQVKDNDGEFGVRNFWGTFVRLVLINDETLKLPQNLIIREYMDGALEGLDPFSNVIWPFEKPEFQKHTMGQFSGVGIQINQEQNKLRVVTPIYGTPAYAAGVMPGDTIVSIDGASTEGLTIDEAVRRITGPKGTQVTLGILHSWQDKPVLMKLTRDTIIIHTVKGASIQPDNSWKYIIDDENKIGYFRITSFTDTTADDLKQAILQARDDGMRGLILDLRFDPGGTLKGAIDTSDIFLSSGVIVSTKGRRDTTQVNPDFVKSADPSGECLDLPVIVLVNEVSASASEIVSGALKDYGRALVIGERSYGKGSVQNVIPIAGDSSRLKLTTAYYYLPSGRCLHRKPDSKTWGVDPDIRVKVTPVQLRDILEIQRDSEIIYNPKNGHPTTTSATTSRATTTSAPATSTAASTQPTTTSRPMTQFPKVDTQLQTALLVMKTRLITGQPWDDVIKSSTSKPAPATEAIPVAGPAPTKNNTLDLDDEEADDNTDGDTDDE